MVYSIYVENAPGFARGGAGPFGRERAICWASRALNGLRAAEPLRRGGHLRRAVFASAGHRFQRAAAGPGLTASCPHRRAGAVFAVEYLPGQFDQRADSAPPSASSSSARASGPRCAPQRFTCYTARLSREGAGCHQKIRHQSGRSAGGVIRRTGRRCGQLRHPEPDSGNAGRASPRLDAAGLADFVQDDTVLPWTRSDIAFCQSYFSSRAARPHHHRDPHDRHLLERPLPPYHLRHHTGRGAARGRDGCRRALEAYLAAAQGAGPGSRSPSC